MLLTILPYQVEPIAMEHHCDSVLPPSTILALAWLPLKLSPFDDNTVLLVHQSLQVLMKQRQLGLSTLLELSCLHRLSFLALTLPSWSVAVWLLFVSILLCLWVVTLVIGHQNQHLEQILEKLIWLSRVFWQFQRINKSSWYIISLIPLCLRSATTSFINSVKMWGAQNRPNGRQWN